ncbi:Paeruginosa anthranilate synthase component II [Teratosphaeria destructans]|uniref:Paeruginosa anthranilate synthase component II n=1 Tax=Teratosphaeria destructans TaxID=418781 RepID=A0A9W7W414_9PEZI|nr:Paeruginosa anthranilate synthase component II [Teratosphaeria destructans]
MRSPIRIAVLECDEPIGKTKEKYGGYGNLFAKLLNAGADKFREKDSVPWPELDISKYDVVNTEVYPNLSDVDAVLLTGSKYNSFDNDPWILKLVDFTRKILNQNRVRLIGVCFGHQIIGRALDVKVARSDRGWEISVTPVALTQKGKDLFGIEDLAIHQMHRDIVYEYPPGIEALGSSPRCEVQGMYAKGRLITVQGHPEFDGDIVNELLENRHRMGIFDDAMYRDGVERVRRHHDGVAVAAAFVRFLLEE